MKDLNPSEAAEKFQDPDVTAKGEPRARVALKGLETLWFNTGTLCNIECVNCYIESSPKNDALVYITVEEVRAYLDEIDRLALPVREIGFTGGEPFMNPQMCDMAELCLARGYEVLILTNAMLPMMRKHVREPLAQLISDYPKTLTLRVSLDHHTQENHDKMRGHGSFERSLQGMDWLSSAGAQMSVAARSIFGETDAQTRAGFAALYRDRGYAIDADSPSQTVIFPEMDMRVDVPEITTACWDILGKSPEDIMCASSRMVVKRKGAQTPTVAACTLLPYEPAFDLGPTLEGAQGDVALNHPHCAKFCVLGGASCSA